MPNLKLHIISFAIPDPADYGGVIDVFYKVKALTKIGVNVILHCYQYDKRQPSKYLESICEEVNYYPRNMSWRKAIGTTPHIMASRYSEALINRLKKDSYPILLEGMHTAAIVNHSVLKSRMFALRMHNIEWNYYNHLAKQESNPIRKIYYKLESTRLSKHKSVLSKVNQIFTISKNEQLELAKQFKNCSYLPVFHSNEKETIKKGRGAYILYHGNLTVAENKRAVNYIVSELYQKRGLDLPIIIAGKLGVKAAESIDTIKNVTFICNPSDDEMQALIQNAQIHLLPTFQSTGIKLKLINALFNGRHCIVNSQMVAGTGLKTLCEVVDNPDDTIIAIRTLWKKTFDETEIAKRKLILESRFSNQKGAKQIKSWVLSVSQ